MQLIGDGTVILGQLQSAGSASYPVNLAGAASRLEPVPLPVALSLVSAANPGPGAGASARWSRWRRWCKWEVDQALELAVRQFQALSPRQLRENKKSRKKDKKSNKQKKKEHSKKKKKKRGTSSTSSSSGTGIESKQQFILQQQRVQWEEAAAVEKPWKEQTGFVRQPCACGWAEMEEEGDLVAFAEGWKLGEDPEVPCQQFDGERALGGTATQVAEPQARFGRVFRCCGSLTGALSGEHRDIPLGYHVWRLHGVLREFQSGLGNSEKHSPPHVFPLPPILAEDLVKMVGRSTGPVPSTALVQGANLVIAILKYLHGGQYSACHRPVLSAAHRRVHARIVCTLEAMVLTDR